jgi:3-deoxy-D-manno-octulosonate 8-phosphate phosphatase (KDO 8-P phosphatase)
VLTNSILQYGPDGGHWKQFHVRDGTGIKALQRSGIPVVFISGLRSNATDQRARDLGVEDCFTGVAAKATIIEKICIKYGVSLEEVAFIGDDLIDIGILNSVGMAICPQDAALEVKQIAHWVVPVDGGRGVLRAVAEFFLKSRGWWEEFVNSYTQ